MSTEYDGLDDEDNFGWKRYRKSDMVKAELLLQRMKTERETLKVADDETATWFAFRTPHNPGKVVARSTNVCHRKLEFGTLDAIADSGEFRLVRVLDICEAAVHFGYLKCSFLGETNDDKVARALEDVGEGLPDNDPHWDLVFVIPRDTVTPDQCRFVLVTKKRVKPVAKKRRKAS